MIHALRASAAAGVAVLALAGPPAAPALGQGQGGADAFHMTLVGHADMQSGGEGFAMKLTGAGRRLLYVAHESGPHCFSIFDVTDPARPATLRVVDTVSEDVRCNSLDVFGNVLAVAAETKRQGQPGGGFRIYALDDPAAPRQVGYFDASGPHSRGAHHVWLSSERLAHITSGAADFTPNRSSDDEFYRIVDIADPAHPHEAGRWWYPGQRAGDAEPAPGEIPLPDESNQGVRPHNIDVFASHANCAYLGYIDGGLVILDISDLTHPRTVSIVRYVGPFTHTVFPLFDRNLAFVSEEAVQDACADAPKHMAVWDIADETKPRLVSVVPYARNSAELCKRGGRYGAQHLRRQGVRPDVQVEPLHGHELVRRRRADLRPRRPPASARGGALRPGAAGGLAETRAADQRRLRRRSRPGVRLRPLHRRALHPAQRRLARASAVDRDV
jgi:hypothetical protein